MKKRKFLSCLLAVAMLTSMSMGTFANSANVEVINGESVVEVAVPYSLQEKVVAQVTREDGTIEQIIPEVTCYRVMDKSRSNDAGETYILQATLPYKSPRAGGSHGETVDANQIDASMTGYIKYSEVSGRLVLDYIEGSYDSYSGVHIYNRRAKYANTGISKTIYPGNSFSMTVNMKPDPDIWGGGPYLKMTCSVEQYSIAEELELMVEPA